MEYINATSSLTGFWQILFYPLILICCLLLTVRFILSKETFACVVANTVKRLERIEKVLNYKKRLGKTAPIVSAFLALSAIYLFSMLYSVLGIIISVDFSLSTVSVLSLSTVLNVWKYHPYIESAYTLQNVVLHQASENGLNTFSYLSTDGLIRLPHILTQSLWVCALIMLLVCIVGVLLKISQRGFIRRLKKIGRALLLVISFTCLLVGYNVLLPSSNSNNTVVNAWRNYESKLLSSGPPPESMVLTEKTAEADEFVHQNENELFRAQFGFGPVSWSFSFGLDGFSTSHYNQLHPGWLTVR